MCHYLLGLVAVRLTLQGKSGLSQVIIYSRENINFTEKPLSKNLNTRILLLSRNIDINHTHVVANKSKTTKTIKRLFHKVLVKRTIEADTITRK